MAVNHLVIQGRNVRDVELRTTQTGIENIDFTVAVNDKYRKSDAQDKAPALFQRCKAWRQTAKFIATYLGKKSDEMIVEGPIWTEKWTDRNGNQRSENILQVEKVHFCGRRQNHEQSGEQPQLNGTPLNPAPDQTFTEVEPKDLPF